MQSESVTKRSHGYNVWFAEERAWTARVTCPAPAELYPGKKGPFCIFDCKREKLAFCGKMCPFAKKTNLLPIAAKQDVARKDSNIAVDLTESTKGDTVNHHQSSIDQTRV
jgi:hypothetical protein